MQNKKALTLLEFTVLIKKEDSKTIGHDILNKAIKWDGMSRVLELYRKKSSPQLISELFEEWETNLGMEVHNKTNMIIFSKDEYGEFFVVNGDFKYKHRVLKINSFIYACQEHQIDLYWKEKVLEKYFNL